MTKKSIFAVCALFFYPVVCFAKTPQIGGFIHARYLAGKAENNSFAVKRVRVVFSGKADENFDYTIRVDSLRQPILLDAVLKYTHSKQFKVDIGQFKIPMSAEALTPVTKQDLINKYRFLSQLFPPSYRDIGIMAEGNIFDGKISYQLGIFNGNGSNNKANDDNQYFYVGRLTIKESFFAVGNWRGKFPRNGNRR